jgi:hypothetical protein
MRMAYWSCSTTMTAREMIGLTAQRLRTSGEHYSGMKKYFFLSAVPPCRHAFWGRICRGHGSFRGLFHLDSLDGAA